MYGDLENDIEILVKQCNDSEELFETVGCYITLDHNDINRIKNIISALTKYRNMYYKEYRHHMDQKEYLRKAEARANHYRMQVDALTEKYIG